jgi:hypothetical protein
MADTFPALLDAGKLGEKIKVRVKELFLDVIPEDVWDGFIKREIDAFFNTSVRTFLREQERPREGTRGYGYDRQSFESVEIDATPFRVCVFQALQPLVKARLAKVLEDPKFDACVQHAMGALPAVQRTGEFFQDTLRQMVPLLVQKMFEGIFTAAAEQMKQSLQAAGIQVR